jgi:hypothetical protein
LVALLIKEKLLYRSLLPPVGVGHRFERALYVLFVE